MTNAEATVDPTDPYEREAQTFPRLSTDMIERVRRYGSEETVPAGSLIFERGQRGVDFFLVLQGRIEIFETGVDGEERVFVTEDDRQFAGEMDLFNDREVLVSARAQVESRLLRVKRARFREMASREADIGEIIMRAFILRRVGLIRHQHGGVVLVGSTRAADTLRLQQFLTRNTYPFRVMDTESDTQAAGFLDCFRVQQDQLPVVLVPGADVLRKPTNHELAAALGLVEEIDSEAICDVAIIGAGPAGLAAAVYAASEGLSTIVLEGLAPGGQAGTSTKIENYLGFPTGISGAALAGRAQAQAQKFGARLAISRPVLSVDCATRPFQLTLEGGQVVQASSVVVATGARYRKLDVDNYHAYEGSGIHYAATAMEAGLCSGQDVVVVGGGNSAGQAAVFLSQSVRHVHILVRGTGLAATMSDYLVERIESSPHITVHAHSTVTALQGDQFLRTVTWSNRQTGESQTHDVGALFVMIGAEPNTEWLDGCLDLDEKGFVLTGRSGSGSADTIQYATSTPGIFAVGDVRSGSVKRVASSVGEGSVVVHAIHRFLHPAV
ncbi:FAD-dependent oxidoreductase [Terrihabitans rhizophilus]|uniref:Thioredoxin reductase n=1 Tax=Terrihabitans rhizophilus TaxID=3092662 RepID=A0ABU4RQU8_9HYPH|nr:FAD-dependent oxidoreductase [Terrihabitans sp. PJ23]MDX6806981.1 FAD-dependent oxidoreductase [Terrihabitans sp. PJ23]